MKNYFLFAVVLPVLTMILAMTFFTVLHAAASDTVSDETSHGLMTSLPPLYTLVDLEHLSKYTLKGKVIDIEQTSLDDKTVYHDTQISAGDISIKIENERYVKHDNETIKFKVRYHSSLDPYSKSVHTNVTYRIGETVTVFLTNKEPEANSTGIYSGFITNNDIFSAGIAYGVTSTKQSPPLQQHKSGVLSRSVNCNDGLDLLIKATNGQPICVTPSTRATLVERSWATQ